MPKYRVTFKTDKVFRQSLEVEASCGSFALGLIDKQMKEKGEKMDVEDAQYIQIN